jgi:hypothetical protein
LNVARCGKGLIEFAPVFIKVREAFVKAKQRTNAVELPGDEPGFFYSSPRKIKFHILYCFVYVFRLQFMTGEIFPEEWLKQREMMALFTCFLGSTREWQIKSSKANMKLHYGCTV